MSNPEIPPRRETPPFLPEKLLRQESEDPRVGPRMLERLENCLSRDRGGSLSKTFSDLGTHKIGLASFASFAAACAWDLSRRVYRVPSAFADELSEGCGDLPASALAHLPVEDLYVSFGDGTGALASVTGQGVLVTYLIEAPTLPGHPVGPTPMAVPWDSTIDEAVGETMETYRKLGPEVGWMNPALGRLLSRTVASLMYLSSENADMVPVAEPRTARRKSIRRLFPDRRPCELTDVGFNVLSALSAEPEAERAEGAARDAQWRPTCEGAIGILIITVPRTPPQTPS